MRHLPSLNRHYFVKNVFFVCGRYGWNHGYTPNIIIIHNLSKLNYALSFYYPTAKNHSQWAILWPTSKWFPIFHSNIIECFQMSCFFYFFSELKAKTKASAVKMSVKKQQQQNNSKKIIFNKNFLVNVKVKSGTIWKIH